MVDSRERQYLPDPVSALRRLIQPLVNLWLADDSHSSWSSCKRPGTMTRARTRSPLTSVWVTSTHLPRSSLPSTVESRSGVARRGRPPAKLMRYTPRGTGSVCGGCSNNVQKCNTVVSVFVGNM